LHHGLLDRLQAPIRGRGDLGSAPHELGVSGHPFHASDILKRKAFPVFRIGEHRFGKVSEGPCDLGEINRGKNIRPGTQHLEESIGLGPTEISIGGGDENKRARYRAQQTVRHAVLETVPCCKRIGN
jgi:hypothetical protein